MNRVALCSIALALVLAGVASAQSISLDKPLNGDTVLPAEMSKIAEQAMAAYRDVDRDRYLDSLFRLQLVAGRNADASTTLAALRDLRRVAKSTQSGVANVRWEIFSQARLIQSERSLPFDVAFKLKARDT
jgi:hypothetical protein